LCYNVADNMHTISNVKALEMALSKIPKEEYINLICHSDRDSQYCSKEYTKILKDCQISISIGKTAHDNAFA